MSAKDPALALGSGAQSYADNPRAAPFTLSMLPLAPDDWLELDDNLGDYLAQKAALIVEDRDAVFRAMPGTEDCQSETLALIEAHLVAQHASRVSRTQDRLIGAGWDVDLSIYRAPLLRAAMLVQDDLVIMRKIDGEYTLVAGCVCFPSSWALSDKFGLGLTAIHAPVPDFAGRMSQMVARVFDHVRPDAPVIRHNFAICADDNLDHRTGPGRHRREGVAGAAPSGSFFRAERQTIVKLPETGDILFTIKVLADPIAALFAVDRDSNLAQRIATQLRAMSAAQQDYKALTPDIDALANYLERGNVSK